MKTQEELNTLKEEIETVNRKFRELTDEELAQVSGGSSRFDLQLEKDIKIIDVVNPDNG